MATKRQSRDLLPILFGVTVAVFAVFAIFVLVRSAVAGSGIGDAQRAEDCESDYQYLLQIESFGHSAYNSHLWDDFQVECNDQAEAVGAYVEARAAARAAANDCAQIKDSVEPGLVALLESYGECDGVPLADGYEATDPLAAEPQPDAPAPAVDPEWPGSQAIGWDLAARYVGTTQRVCGPLTSVRATEDGTFVNIGTDYPSTERFTFVFWDMYLSPIEAGVIVCGQGEIYLYEGVVAQAELWDPGALEIWR
jgi:hypothetical protein